MAVTAYIARDLGGNPWPLVHEHEAVAAIGLIQRLYEAVNHEPTMYAIFTNLQTPHADVVVLSELGLGVIELKHHASRLFTQDTDWYAGTMLIKAGAGHSNPREQVQAYAHRIRRYFIPQIASWWAADQDEMKRSLKIQTAVCFTNPRIEIEQEVKETIEQEARMVGRRWSDFRVLIPTDFAVWVSALRFGLEQDHAANFAPYRLTAPQINTLARFFFKGNEWTEIRNLMPTGQPYAYIILQQQAQESQVFPLRATDTTIGRDSGKCMLLIPEGYARVSRQHACMSRIAGNIWIKDLGSSHGTYINGARIYEITRLQPGDRITLGGSTSSGKVCELLFMHQLPSDLHADPTTMNPTTIPS
jgi:hypothetical protein